MNSLWLLTEIKSGCGRSNVLKGEQRRGGKGRRRKEKSWHLFVTFFCPYRLGYRVSLRVHRL